MKVAINTETVYIAISFSSTYWLSINLSISMNNVDIDPDRIIKRLYFNIEFLFFKRCKYILGIFILKDIYIIKKVLIKYENSKYIMNLSNEYHLKYIPNIRIKTETLGNTSLKNTPSTVLNWTFAQAQNTSK